MNLDRTTAEFIGGPMDGETMVIPGRPDKWKIQFVRGTVLDREIGYYLYRLADPNAKYLDADGVEDFAAYVYDGENK